MKSLLLSALFALAFLAAPALADDVTFVMQNDHPNAVELELYSQDREHVWPGHDQVCRGGLQSPSLAISSTWLGDKPAR